MFSYARIIALAAVAAFVAPVTASAATFNEDLNVGVSYSFAQVVSPGGSFNYVFNVLDDIEISAFSISATGTGSTAAIAENDVRDIRFGFSLPATNLFSVVQSMGTTAAGFGFLPGGSFSAGDTFSIFFVDGIVNDVGLTLSFLTEAPAPVPLPAAGLMLAPVLIAGGVAAVRRRKAAKASV